MKKQEILDQMVELQGHGVQLQDMLEAIHVLVDDYAFFATGTSDEDALENAKLAIKEAITEIDKVDKNQVG